MPFTKKEKQDLVRAKKLLESTSFAVKLSDALGSTIEKGFEFLPDKWTEAMQKVIRSSLERAFKLTVRTLNNRPKTVSSDKLHKLAIVSTGAAGGFFGLAALTVELPVSTIIIMRSILDIARNEGEAIKTIETRLACLEVFALGGGTDEDHSTQTGYFAIRAILAKEISGIIENISERLVAKGVTPQIGRFLSQIGTRYGVMVSNKIAAQTIPVAGALGGAAINTIFINHFQAMARGHFIIRRLERKHGKEEIERLYHES
ncbi:MAG: EcsC family protein [Candidatus Glassbacteria bacterium]|nr:EcsC family protein [Candidatus Glassbacteria bacterium]